MFSDVIIPRVEYAGDILTLWAIRLSKAGYGAIDLLLTYSSDIFLNILDYENYTKDFELEQRALNRRN